MTTLNSLAESLAFPVIDSLYIDNLKPRILHFRNIAIKREFEKTNIYPHSLIQTLHCIKVVNIEDCQGKECIGETEIVLPKPLILKYNEPFISIGNTLNFKFKSISYIKPEELEYIEYRKWTSKQPYCYYNNGKLRFVNSTVPEVNIRTIWDDPISVKGLNDERDCNIENFFEDDLIIDDLLAGIITTFIANDSTNQK